MKVCVYRWIRRTTSVREGMRSNPNYNFCNFLIFWGGGGRKIYIYFLSFTPTKKTCYFFSQNTHHKNYYFYRQLNNRSKKDIYAVLIHRTQNDASFKTKWESIFTETIKCKKKLADCKYYDYDMIYKIIRNVTAVRKNLHDWNIEPTPNWVFCNSVDSVLHAFFHCSKVVKLNILLNK